MIPENEQRLREALLLLDFSPEELADLSRDELRILAATPYLPPPLPTEERAGDPLQPRQRALLAALLAAARPPRTATPAPGRLWRKITGRPRLRRRKARGTGPPDG